MTAMDKIAFRFLMATVFLMILGQIFYGGDDDGGNGD